MINLLSAATSTPLHEYKTTELVGALMHKLSPELINTINNLGVDKRYSALENYPEFWPATERTQQVRRLNSVSRQLKSALNVGTVTPRESDYWSPLPIRQIKCCLVSPLR